LIDDLPASLGEDTDAAVTAAWDAEIQRRLSRISAGEPTLIDPDELMRRTRAQCGADLSDASASTTTRTPT
jgi:hypothetical protein